MTRILLAEDDPLNRDMLSRRLTRSGYEVITAVDGEDAVAKANNAHPALILMDMQMPRLDGWGATAQLKADAGTSDIPVIGLTATIEANDRVKAIAAGFVELVEKPVIYDALLATMRELLGESEGP
jgi:CheY-like chemotaxis protein